MKEHEVEAASHKLWQIKYAANELATRKAQYDAVISGKHGVSLRFSFFKPKTDKTDAVDMGIYETHAMDLHKDIIVEMLQREITHKEKELETLKNELESM